MNSKEKKSKINIFKLIIVSIICILLFSYILYSIIELIKKPTNLFVVESGQISLEEDATGYVIRDEIIISGENYSNGLVQIKTDGERVAKGESVFRYYSKNEETLNEKIEELDLKIQEALEGQTNIYSNDIKILESQIEENLKQIRETNDILKIKEYKKNINNAITKKAKIIGEQSPSGSYIRQLIQERSSYENELNSGVEYVKAPTSGIVSYRIDGLEEVFSINDFSNLNKEMLEGLNLKTGQIVATSNESGKIINNFYAYIATVMDSETAKNKKIGDTVTIRLSSSTEVKGEITYLKEQEDGSILLIFKITKGVEELINYRKVSIDVIWWNDSGLKVANSAIRYEDNIPYVIKNMAGYEYKIYVKIVSKNENYSIVKNYTTDEYRELGFSDEEIKNMKKITLYDEILTNPNV